MTERTASGRALGALKAIGMDEAPLTTLEREDALFVLTGQTLVYQDGGGTRRVTLRDLTRIHSDEQGMLRVETPAGTALTASLLGFDVPEVQVFFAQVRDTTARAKDMPVSPLPAPGAFKTFGTPSLPPRPEAGQERAADDVAPVRQQPASQPPGSLQPAPNQPPATLASADQRLPIPPPREALTPAKDAPQAETARAQAADSERPSTEHSSTEHSSAERSASETSSPQPAVTQKSSGEGTQGQKAEPATPGNGRAPLPPMPRPAGTVESPSPRPTPLQASPAQPSSATLPPTSPQSTPPPAAPPGSGLAAAVAARPVVISSSAFTPTPARAATPAADALRVAPAAGAALPATGESAGSAPSAPVAPPPQTLDGLHRTLARQADVVGDLVGRLRFLGGVLFAAALLLSLVQFTADARLDALWTLLSGGVGTIALLALAELARLLALLGRSVALSAGTPASGTPAPAPPGGATDAR